MRKAYNTLQQGPQRPTGPSALHRVACPCTLLPFPLAGTGQRMQGASYLGAGPGAASCAGRGGDRADGLSSPAQAAPLGLEPAQGQPPHHFSLALHFGAGY